MYHPREIIEVLAGNVRKTRSPFGVPHWLANGWWKDLEFPPEGEALLFTGMMYQFTPYIERTTHYLEKFEETQVAHWFSLARYQPKRLAGVGLALLASKQEKQRANRILRDIVLILSKSKVPFQYRPSLDAYSGILLYDLGDQENFVRHARWVTARLEKAGVREIITVDPHTTYALKVLYPKFAGARFKVRSYVELVNFESKNGGAPVTLHDPCFYGRYLEISDAPRKALKQQGIECLEVLNAQTYTQCCGGPAESISPKLSREVMQRRLAELQTTGAPLVAMCPICLGNLRRSGAAVEDLAEILARSARAA
jgi:Fe-S oxidoreductase